MKMTGAEKKDTQLASYLLTRKLMPQVNSLNRYPEKDMYNFQIASGPCFSAVPGAQFLFILVVNPLHYVVTSC